MSDPLAAKAEAQALTLALWQKMAATAVAKGVAAAHAHAVVALTDTLKRTPDGRATIRKARQSRSFAAAIADLDDTWGRLAGYSTTAINGLVRDARSDFYSESFNQWVDLIPVEFLNEKLPEGSVARRLTEMRRLVLHGMELRVEIGAKVGDAKRTLLAALEQAARKSNPGHVATDILDGWRESSTSAITRSALVALSDSQVAIDGIAMVDVTKPEFRPKDEFTPT